MTTALDSNILSALWSSEPAAPHILRELNRLRALGGIVVCAPVYVELTAHPKASQKFIDQFFRDTEIAIDFELDESVWRRAADGFASYAQRRRQSGGSAPKRMLVDFLIAAHALLRTEQLMTLDPSRYKRDFPTLRLV